MSIPGSVKRMSVDAFRGCKNLESITFAGMKEDWQAIRFIQSETVRDLYVDGESREAECWKENYRVNIGDITWVDVTFDSDDDLPFSNVEQDIGVSEAGRAAEMFKSL